MRVLLSALCLLAFAGLGMAQEKKEDKKELTLKEKIAEVNKDSQAANKDFNKKYNEAMTPQEKQAVIAESNAERVKAGEKLFALAKENAKLNRAQIKFIQSDLFPWLRDIIPNGERFDVVILDPAKMTRDRDDVLGALKKYLDMNRLAMMALAPGGILLTCSCTGLVPEADFVEMLRRAAWQVGRTAQIFKITGAASDHPFFVHVPEGRYLKAIFARVF